MSDQAPGKILVTGAGGFLGFHMANYFADRGHQVTGMDVSFAHIPAEKGGARFSVVESDFRNWDETEKAVKDADIIYHFASAHLQISLDESEYWDINVHSLRKLLEMAHRHGVKRFIHISSVGAYGKLQEIPANEETPCHPQSIYGETKLAGEAVVREVGAETGLPFVILRPAWIYGIGCPRTEKLQRAMRKRRFLMIGKGENKRHPMYIKDMLTVCHLAMEKDAAVGETMIIGGDEIITTRELIDSFSEMLHLPKPLVTIPYPLGVALASTIEAVFTTIGKEPPISRRTLEFFDTDNGFDIGKSKRVLGFQPEFSFRQGLADYQRIINHSTPE